MVNKFDVSVGQWYLFFAYPMASNHLIVNVTSKNSINSFEILILNLNLICLLRVSDELNGRMVLKQNSDELSNENVASNESLEQKIVLREADYASISNETSIFVHWFIDCNYVRRSKELNTIHIFSEPNKTHHIEALVEISFEPLVSTSTSKTVPTLKSRLISDWQTMHQHNLPYVCFNKSKIQPDAEKIYGYFAQNITVFGSNETIPICICMFCTSCS